MAAKKRTRLLIVLSLILAIVCVYHLTSSSTNTDPQSFESQKDQDINLNRDDQKLDDGVKFIANYARKVKELNSDAFQDEKDVSRHLMAIEDHQNSDKDRLGIDYEDAQQRNTQDSHQIVRISQDSHNQYENLKGGVLDRPHPKTECRDVLCTEYLNKTDLYAFNVCRIQAKYKMSIETAEKKNVKELAKTYDVDVNSDPLTSGGCKFMNGMGRGVYGLISFPGSGNTWVRGLLQAATGICTGAVYCDGILRGTGFDGEGVRSSSVLCVKEHTFTPKWTLIRNERYFDKKNRPHYDKVILLVRNPFHALVSEWNRKLGIKSKNKSTSHTDSFGPEYFGDFRPWTIHLKGNIKKWIQGFDWLISSPRASDAMMVRYEDLRRKLVSEVKRMTDFLGVDVSESVISERLEAAQFHFHRKKPKLFDHFTSEQRQFVVSAIATVANSLHKKFSTTFSIEKYME